MFRVRCVLIPAVRVPRCVVHLMARAIERCVQAKDDRRDRYSCTPRLYLQSELEDMNDPRRGDDWCREELELLAMHVAPFLRDSPTLPLMSNGEVAPNVPSSESDSGMLFNPVDPVAKRTKEDEELLRGASYPDEMCAFRCGSNQDGENCTFCWSGDRKQEAPTGPHMHNAQLREHIGSSSHDGIFAQVRPF
jgi:hypothetical protein